MIDSHRIERALWIAALACLSACALIFVQAHRVEARAMHLSKDSRGSQDFSGGEQQQPARNEILARLEIPALALSVPVLNDYDPATLREGVGHIGGTALPGGLGNVGLAGHRDTFFRPLRRSAAGMQVRLSDRTGVYRYVIDGTEIVTPDKVSVLAIGPQPQLTLITCFPFDYIGPAPRRFIVHAHLLSAVPDPPPSLAAKRSSTVQQAGLQQAGAP